MRPKSVSDISSRVVERTGPRGQRVEQPHLHVRKRRERAEQLVFAGGVEVVHQQAHAHAARGGLAQLLQEQQADVVVLDQVVLHVERLLGVPRERDARVEGEGGLGQQPETRQRGRTARRVLGRELRQLGPDTSVKASVGGGSRLAAAAGSRSPPARGRRSPAPGRQVGGEVAARMGRTVARGGAMRGL
jgi:hypothetical protein